MILLFIFDTIPPIPTIPGLKSEWAILLGFFILTLLQGYKIWSDNRAQRTNSLEKARLEITLTSIERYLKIQTNKYTEEITDLQLPVLIQAFVGHARESLSYHAAGTVHRNEVHKNRAMVRSKITHFIDSRYKEISLGLSRFKYKGMSMNEFITCETKQDLIDGVLEIIFEDDAGADKTYRNLGAFIEQHFDDLHQCIMKLAYTK